MAEVNDKGEVTVEGELIGRLEGFRFRQDQTASADEAKTLRQASLAALTPLFHLRADKFYNAPDTEFDFTEQGGLMWGDSAVGKLVRGDDSMRPQVQAFVDDEAGHDVTEKVRRRLQHFIDRKIAALFEPLLNMSRDEALNGLARGIAFQLVEAMGVIPRERIAADIKALDQDARGLLRKHGVRFGQYTIFLPLLLKPAPTRLRLVLRSLAEGLDEFPESPPPGLVTIPHLTEVPSDHYIMAGYRPAGARAIRIDMLERLADLLRACDSRSGFEATPDMLSITGTTLEQFADLMEGLGYKAERGERAKVKPEQPAAPSEVVPEAPDAATPDTDASAQAPEPDVAAAREVEAQPAESAEADPPEVFFTFTWAPRPRKDIRPQNKPQDARPKGGKSKGAKPKGKKPEAKREYAASTAPRKSDRIDPDNPFAAALMGLKTKG